VPKKLDISLDVPELLDLEHLRSHGLQSDEQLLPETNDMSEGSAAGSVRSFEFNASLLAQLTEMGFALDGCKRALYHTNNGDIETTMNWIMEHMSDPDFAQPFNLEVGAKSNVSFSADPESLATIMSMGFTHEQALRALRATDNNMERAVDWIFSHADELDTQPMQTDANQSQASNTSNFRDGNAKYELMAFISHMGTSTMCGHYVCHILKDKRWVIFNDNKVALSESPPKDLAYMYLYRRSSH